MQRYVLTVKKIKINWHKLAIWWIRWALVLVVAIIHFYLSVNLAVIYNWGFSLGLRLVGIKWITAIVLMYLLAESLLRFKWGVWLIFCGGIVNWWDRCLDGRVSDYFKIWFVYNNLPDLLIFGGIILFINDALRHKNRI